VLEPGERPGTARVPFPVVDREAYLKAVRGKGIADRVEKAPIKRVPLRSLKAIQKTVNAERLAEHVADPNLIPEDARKHGSGMLTSKPVIVKLAGELHLHDGHHRATAALLRGEDSIKARVVDLDEEAA
jgi:hypothetical protein